MEVRFFIGDSAADAGFLFGGHVHLGRTQVDVVGGLEGYPCRQLVPVPLIPGLAGRCFAVVALVSRAGGAALHLRLVGYRGRTTSAVRSCRRPSRLTFTGPPRYAAIVETPLPLPGCVLTIPGRAPNCGCLVSKGSPKLAGYEFTIGVFPAVRLLTPVSGTLFPSTARLYLEEADYTGGARPMGVSRRYGEV